FIKQQQRDKSLQLGRELAERELRRFSLNLSKLLKAGELKTVANELGFRLEDDLLVAVGYGKVTPQQLVQALVPPERVQEEKKAAQEATASQGTNGSPLSLGGLSRGVTEIAKKLVGKQSRTGVQIGGVDDVLVRFGRCCNPVPGDSIVGFITR